MESLWGLGPLIGLFIVYFLFIVPLDKMKAQWPQVEALLEKNAARESRLHGCILGSMAQAMIETQRSKGIDDNEIAEVLAEAFRFREQTDEMEAAMERVDAAIELKKGE